MSKKIDKIAAKKLELEQNIARLQEGLEQNLEQVKEDVVQQVQPKEFIKKHPLSVVGVAVATGFLMGFSRKKKVVSVAPKSRVSSSFGESIKRRLTQKAIDLGLDYLESRFLSAKEKEEQ